MRDFSCFGENGVQIADPSSTRATQNIVTSVYQCQIQENLGFITVTWAKNLLGQGVTICISDSTHQCLCRHDIKPWLFSKKKGYKSLEMDSTSITANIYWDLSSAKFGPGPEPLEGFYMAVLVNQEIILLLGDLQKELYNKIATDHFEGDAVLVAKKEHIFGKKHYRTRAQLSNKGQSYEISIECDTSANVDHPWLVIRVNSRAVLQVKHLRWKFRGNHVILVDGLPVEVYWDVYGWLFENVIGGNNAVFLFRTRHPSDKLNNNNNGDDECLSSWSGSQRFKDYQKKHQGFSLLLYAWKNEA